MVRIWSSPEVPATSMSEAARIAVSQHSADGFCSHLEVLPTDRAAFMVSGHYDMSIDDAMEDGEKRYQDLR